MIYAGGLLCALQLCGFFTVKIIYPDMEMKDAYFLVKSFKNDAEKRLSRKLRKKIKRHLREAVAFSVIFSFFEFYYKCDKIRPCQQ
ncbi:MAG: hypothetical protein LBV16_03810 [Elusimicrobiota bacterium]|nr:hypothetical protein [Elusimicrobiota bacterium]